MSAEPSPKRERLLSLDVFRGLTIAGMILVNNAGDWSYVWWPLKHKDWHGWTPTDLIFPFFVFIVGVAISLSVGEKAPDRRAVVAVLKRSAILFALGVFLNAFPFNLERPVRVLGVLQRIGLVFAATSLLVLFTRWRTQIVVTVVILAGYVALVGRVDAPGLDLGARVDRALLGGRLYQAKPDFALFDPEGLFSSIPAVATCLLGVFAGRWLQDPACWRVTGLSVAGALLAGAGLVLDLHQPINKPLWTSSYVLFTGGLASVALGLAHLVVDRFELRRWAYPFAAFGRNAILTYMASHLLARFLVYGITFAAADGKTVSLKATIYSALFPTSTELTSFVYALVYVLIWTAIAIVLDMKKIYWKV